MRPRAARGDIIVYDDGSIQVDDDGHVGVDNAEAGCCCGDGNPEYGSGSGSGDGGDDGGDTGDGDLDPIPCSEPLGCDFTVIVGPPSPKTCSCPSTDPLYDPQFNICPQFGQLTAIVESIAGAGGGWTFSGLDPVSAVCHRSKGGGRVSWRNYNTPDTEACDPMHEVCATSGYRMTMTPGLPGLYNFGLVVGTSAETGGCPENPGVNSAIAIMSFIVACRDGFWVAGSMDPVLGFVPGTGQRNDTQFSGECSVGIFR